MPSTWWSNTVPRRSGWWTPRSPKRNRWEVRPAAAAALSRPALPRPGRQAPAGAGNDNAGQPTSSGYPFNRPHPISWSDLHHICHGDPNDEGKGGHLHGTGRPGKTEFPPDWDDVKVSEALTSVASRPEFFDERANEVWFATGTHDGVTVTAVVRPDGSVAAGWPERGPGVHRNPPARGR
jgi:hypothetical protein